jgi:hypothetical protein
MFAGAESSLTPATHVRVTGKSSSSFVRPGSPKQIPSLYPPMSLIADEQLHTNTYIWSQEKDQVTISFLVPEHCKKDDLKIVIEQQHVQAGLKDQEPVVKVSTMGMEVILIP